MDKIFLLSSEDVTNPRYVFCSDASKKDATCQRTNTAFVAENPEMTPEGHGDCWWLRSPGGSSRYAMIVNYDGYVYLDGGIVDCSDIAVCPALRLNLKSAHWSFAGTVCSNSAVEEIPFEKKMQSTTLKKPRRKDRYILYDCIWFGHYPQTDATGANVEPIKWRVLEVKDGIALLHADQNLDVQPFNRSPEDVTWKNCTLRSWLNGYGPQENICNLDYRADNFLNRAFTPAEQDDIC